MTWALIGGPHNLESGSGDVPSGYVLEGPGTNLGPTYASVLRDADSVFRWADDARDIRDGELLIDQLEDGSIQFALPAELAGILPSTQPIRFALGALKDTPESDEAQAFRELVATYRDRGLI